MQRRVAFQVQGDQSRVLACPGAAAVNSTAGLMVAGRTVLWCPSAGGCTQAWVIWATHLERKHPNKIAKISK